MRMRKGQTALEYLMTYGWAILIVIVAIGALYALGLTKTCRWVGTQVSGFSGGGFDVATPRFDASDDRLVFDLKRIGANTVTLDNVKATFKAASQTNSTVNGTMLTGGQKDVTFTWTGDPAQSGDCYSVDVEVAYTESTRAFTAAGKVSGTIEA